MTTGMDIPLATPQTGAAAGKDVADTDTFDLDVTILELGDPAAPLINMTDDGCGSTCSSPCATNIG